MNTKEKDSQYIMHTYGRYNVALKSGKGATAYDEDGKKYVDVASGIGVNSLGWCEDGWVKAVSEQANTIQHMSNYFYCPQASNLAEKLCTLTGFSKVCFGNSGAEANECAIKVARKYSFDKYGADRNEIITLNNSFHGRTVTTLSATGQDVFHNYFFPFTQGFAYVDANDMNALENAVTDKTCAVMLELIQGEGGVNILDKDYVQSLVKFCNEKDILVIVDEVQTGAGRTGTVSYTHLRAHETFGANPVVCAGANYVLDKISKPEFLSEVESKGKYIEEKVLKMDGVKAVRRMGLMIGIELKDSDAHDIAAKCVENGLIIITAKSLLRMLPPLNITKKEIDLALDILEKTLKEN